MYARILKGSYGKPCEKCGKVHTDAYAAEMEHVGKDGELVEKANPNRDSDGRFASKPGGSGGKGSSGKAREAATAKPKSPTSPKSTGRETEAPPPKSNEMHVRDAGNMGWAGNKDAPKEAKSLRSTILRNKTLADNYSGDDRVYPVLHRLDRLYDDLNTMRENHRAAGAKKPAAKPKTKKSDENYWKQTIGF